MFYLRNDLIYLVLTNYFVKFILIRNAWTYGLLSLLMFMVSQFSARPRSIICIFTTSKLSTIRGSKSNLYISLIDTFIKKILFEINGYFFASAVTIILQSLVTFLPLEARPFLRHACPNVPNSSQQVSVQYSKNENQCSCAFLANAE